MVTRKQLRKLYPLADEDYLVAIVEGKVHTVNYIKAKKHEVTSEFDKYIKRINNTFVSYLNDNERDYFLPEDVSMLKTWKKEIKSIIEEYLDWCYEIYATSVVEMYNYKRLYNLWLLAVINGDKDIYEKPVVGEAKFDKRDIVDPTPKFTDKKASAIINQKLYGSSYPERSATALSNALHTLDISMSGVTTGGAKDVTKYLTSLEKNLRKDLSSRIANAVSLGVEGAEDISDYDVFTANPNYGGKYQRVEILDNKTCLVCASLDKKVYKKPIGRIHPNCRGVDAIIPDEIPKEKIKEMSSNSKRRESFDSWFNSLTEEQKKSTLGKTKYDKYKEGKINVHDIVKQSRVIGAKEVEAIDQFKNIPNLKNDISTARNVIDNEAKKLPKRRIDKIKTSDDINSYMRFIDKKESIYKGLDSKALTKAGVSRRTLNAEISRERRVLRLKQKELSLNELTKKKKA